MVRVLRALIVALALISSAGAQTFGLGHLGGSYGASSLIPTPPGTSAYLTNMQLDAVGTSNGQWTKCNANGTNDNGTACAAGTPNGLGDATLTTNFASSPSRASAPAACQAAGNTMKITNTTAGGTVNTSGTAVTWVSGSVFNANWNGSPISINGVTYTIATVPDTTHMTLTATAGTQTGVAYASTTGFNTLFYHHSGNSILGQDSVTTWTPSNIQNLLVHMCYYFDPSGASSWVGPEWDPDMFAGSLWTYKISWACYHTTDKWNVYDQSIQNWRATSIPCDVNTTGSGKWLEFWFYATIDQTNHTYTYQAFTENGSTIWSPASPPPCPSLGTCATFGGWNHNSGNNTNFETQLDTNTTAGTLTSHVYKYEAWVW